MRTHLQDRQHYIDRYDRITVEDCRRSEAIFLRPEKDANKDEKQAVMEAEIARYAWSIKQMYLTKHWYDNKESTINKWMSDDENRDRILNDAIPPTHVFCNECGGVMHEDSRTIYSVDEPERVLFFMRCSQGHMPMKSAFEDGTVRESKPDLCPECNEVLDVKPIEGAEDEITTKYSCGKCGYENVDTFKLTSKFIENDPKFETDRARFCLAGEALREVQENVMRMEQMKELVDKIKHKEEHEEEYNAVAKLEKLTIPQVKARLGELLADTQYKELKFEKPLIEKFVSIEFTVEEMETDNSRASCAELKKLLKKSLESTNWRLMTQGIDYRLGLLSGRIRAYESEEEQLKLVAR